MRSAGTAAAVLATALLLAALAGPCGAVQQAGEASGAAINAAGAQPTDAAAHLAAAAAAASLEAAAQDDSVRCRLSGICEGPPTGCTGSDDAACEHDDEDARLACLTSDAERAAAVQAAARHAWGGYRDCAWGQDELLPISCAGGHWLNLSLTMVDSLDTLLLLGMQREFEEAARWLAEHLDVGAPAEVNLFETTIRILGGLLSAQALSAESHPELSRMLAEKAAELGARLLPAFDSPSGVPYSDVNLRTGKGSMPAWGQISSLSEISSVSLEFTYLARITGHKAFEDTPLAVHDRLEGAHADGGGLLGQFFNPLTGKSSKAHGHTITLGARSDSYYEYLLKQWLLTGKQTDWLRERYVQAMKSVRSRLLRRTAPPGRPGLWYVAEQSRHGKLSRKFDHLVCFLPGLLALGDFHGVSTARTLQEAAADSAAEAVAAAKAAARAAEAAAAETAAAAAAMAAAEAAASNAEGLGEREPGSDAVASGDAAPSLQQQQEQLVRDAQQQAQQAQQAAQRQQAQQDEEEEEEAHPQQALHAQHARSMAQDGRDMPDLQLAAELALTCYELYRRTPAGLAPEIVHFANNTEIPLDFPNKHVHDVGQGDFSIKPNDAHNLLRPESVESFYILWKATGDPRYKQWAWQVFRALEKWARVRPSDRHHACAACQAEAAASRQASAAAAKAAGEGSSTEGSKGGDGGAAGESGTEPAAAAAGGATGSGPVQLGGGTERCSSCSSSGGYTSLESVLHVPPHRRDKMESFFVAETLKYLFLIFAEPPDRCLHPSCAPTTAGTAADPATNDVAAAGAAGAEAGLASQPGASQGRQQREGQQGQQAQQTQQGGQRGRSRLPLDAYIFTTEAHPLPFVGPAGGSWVSQVFQPSRRQLRPFEKEVGAATEAAAAKDGAAAAKDGAAAAEDAAATPAARPGEATARAAGADAAAGQAAAAAGAAGQAAGQAAAVAAAEQQQQQQAGDAAAQKASAAETAAEL